MTREEYMLNKDKLKEVAKVLKTGEMQAKLKAAGMLN
jgi:hypothetical protein